MMVNILTTACFRQSSKVGNQPAKPNSGGIERGPIKYTAVMPSFSPDTLANPVRIRVESGLRVNLGNASDGADVLGVLAQEKGRTMDFYLSRELSSSY
jgi:hypothetical protein